MYREYTLSLTSALATPSGTNGDEQSRRAMLKTLCMNEFKNRWQKRVKMPPLPREDVYDFVASRAKEKEETWQIVQEEQEEEDGARFALRSYTAVAARHNKGRRVTMPTIMTLKQSDGLCSLCNQSATLCGYPCRVCTRTFHKECLEKSGHYKKGDLDILPRAHSNTGWSCFDCDNITTLLTHEQMTDMIDEFEKYDINRDSSVSVDEFIRVQENALVADEGRKASEQDKQRFRMQFKLMDVDGSGTIDWWEFMKHETCKKLVSHDKAELVKHLTKKEVLTAKQLFNTFDTNKDGYISEFEVKEAYRKWYSNFDSGHRPSQDGMQLLRDSTSLNMHVDQHTKILMDADINQQGVITWDDFLKEQALYLICSRPNKAYFLGS